MKFINWKDPMIIISGIEFLEENLSMNWAKAFLKELKIDWRILVTLVVS